MSHYIYSTDSIILKRVESAEADITYWILSKDLGLIIARAQSVRKDKAKMRGHLQLFSYCRVSLVRGRYLWRITGVENVSGNSQVISTEGLYLDKLNAFARIAEFVCRMTITNTTTTAELFDNLLSARINMPISEDANKCELVSIASILITLGYLDEAILSQFTSKEISQNQLSVAVNNSISESHL